MSAWKAILAGLLISVALLPGHGPLLASAAGSTLWYPEVGIVWPHVANGNQATIAASTAINVSVWPTLSVSCTQNPGLSLWMATNNDPAVPVPVQGRLIQRGANGAIFPSLEFNDVPANIVGDPTAKYSLVAGADLPVSNVWVHAADPRTYYPRPLVPNGYGVPKPGQLDTRIQIVFPHDAQGRQVPVAQASFVNIAADIFLHGSLESVPSDFKPEALSLQEALANNPLGQLQLGTATPQAERTTYAVNGQTYPRWIFNDVPVQPSQQYHFAAYVYWGKILSPYSSIWTHATDARTILPNPRIPPGCTS